MKNTILTIAFFGALILCARAPVVDSDRAEMTRREDAYYKQLWAILMKEGERLTFPVSMYK